MKDPQEFLHYWERKNNPDYPQEMVWDRVKVNQFLAEFKSQYNTDRKSNSWIYVIIGVSSILLFLLFLLLR